MSQKMGKGRVLATKPIWVIENFSNSRGQARASSDFGEATLLYFAMFFLSFYTLVGMLFWFVLFYFSQTLDFSLSDEKSVLSAFCLVMPVIGSTSHIAFGKVIDSGSSSRAGG
ncbi:unnamed protein product [Cuscuta epithymum]|uniref:Uncharacterized protein n=1 Tax=Cuscuta epithymum TaxID=186058 RepID=A0AAV0G0J7_9ASTE|nr:unnamed protein product [Cuscuta epithymum]